MNYTDRKQSGAAGPKGLRILSAFGAAVVAVAGLFWAGTQGSAVYADVAGPEVVVYKTPNCGCCHSWMAHLRENGFKVVEKNVATTQAIRAELGVPSTMTSCHTAVVGDYWFEGHVPADLVRRVLNEKPDEINGIAAPGMPVGSPGMEGSNPVTYDLVAHHNDGNARIYATREGKSLAD